MTDASSDRARATAARRVLRALERLHRRAPLVPDVRVDALIADLRSSEGARPSSHRGAGRLPLTDAELRSVVDDLVSRGELVRSGHRVRLPSHLAALPDAWRERANELIDVLRSESPSPPRADAVARRLGLPDAALDHLRATGELVAFAPGIDYPGDVAADLLAQAHSLRDTGELSVAALRKRIGSSRRFAAAVIGALDDDSE